MRIFILLKQNNCLFIVRLYESYIYLFYDYTSKFDSPLHPNTFINLLMNFVVLLYDHISRFDSLHSGATSYSDNRVPDS